MIKTNIGIWKILLLILLFVILIVLFLGGTREQEGYTNGIREDVYTDPHGHKIDLLAGQTGVAVVIENPYKNTGTSYDNYNHYTGASVSTIYYGPLGGTAKVVENNGHYEVIETDKNGNITIYKANGGNEPLPPPPNSSVTTYYGPNGGNEPLPPPPNSSVTTYYGPNGGKATIVSTENGKAIRVMDINGTITLYTTNYNNGVNVTTNTDAQVTTATGPYGNSVSKITGPYDNTAIVTNDNNNNNDSSINTKYGPYGGSVTTATGPNGGTATKVNAPNTGYDSVYGKGVGKSAIPPGQEDLYILKSEIVPPVCPACPTSSACPRQEKCPPCPACARCPEPSFECKKVPNYNAINNEYLPMPVLNDFSTFGM